MEWASAPYERKEMDRGLQVIVPDLVRSVFGDEVVDRDFLGYEHAFEGSLFTEIGSIAYVGLTERIIGVDNHDMRVAGIGFVCVHPDHRGKGLMKSAMRIIHTRAEGLGLPFVLLWTGTPDVYASLDYRHPVNLPPLWLMHELDGDWPESALIDLKGTW